MNVKEAKEKFEQLGEKLGFKQYTEVRGLGSITIDVVWFRKDQLQNGKKPVLKGVNEERRGIVSHTSGHA